MALIVQFDDAAVCRAFDYARQYLQTLIVRVCDEDAVRCGNNDVMAWRLSQNDSIHAPRRVKTPLLSAAGVWPPGVAMALSRRAVASAGRSNHPAFSSSAGSAGADVDDYRIW